MAVVTSEDGNDLTESQTDKGQTLDNLKQEKKTLKKDPSKDKKLKKDYQDTKNTKDLKKPNTVQSKKNNSNSTVVEAAATIENDIDAHKNLPKDPINETNVKPKTAKKKIVDKSNEAENKEELKTKNTDSRKSSSPKKFQKELEVIRELFDGKTID